MPVDIPVSVTAVSDTRMATTISPGGQPGLPTVQTIEHLLSACAGLGLDNLVIDISGEEVPVLDGSAASFVYLLQSAGIVMQDAPKRFLRVKKTVEIREGEGAALKWARLEPYHGYKLSFEIEFNHPAVDETGQQVVFDFSQGQYKRDIARARTFGFTKDVEMMRSRGLGLGGSMDNVIVVDDSRVLNAEGLRYGDEFAKHKILDAIGDLHVLGQPLLAALQRLPQRPCAEQQAAARAAGRPERARDRHLRRRGAGAAGLCRAGPGMVIFRLVFGAAAAGRAAVLRDVHRHAAARCGCSAAWWC